jgi:alkyl sulfatase BDS1-like metallo-beta-lactamase superfamily hydrolase
MNQNNNFNEETFENSGIGPFFGSGPLFTHSSVMPTFLLHDEYTKINIGGLDIELYHAQGETVDQIFVYIPSKRVLLPADNIYKTFPNIYAIRGSPSRDAREWVKSLDKMRAVRPKPEFLVPCHTRPVYGANEISELLTIYRDGIAYVHDQTIRWVNKGYTPDEMIPLIHKYMPERLRQHPYLQEFYGTIDWSVRGIFHSYLGWFSGDPVDLFPLSLTESGDFLINLMDNNLELLFENAEQAYFTGTRQSCQWTLKIGTQILKSTIAKENDRKKASSLKQKALQCLAGHMTSANGRNYYLTTLLEHISDAQITVDAQLKEFAVSSIPLEHVFAQIRVRLKIEDLTENQKNMSVCHDFYNKWFLLQIRDGIIEIHKGSDDNNINDENKNESDIDNINSQIGDLPYIDQYISQSDCHKRSHLVTLCSEETFRSAITATKTTPAMLYANGKFQIIKGSILDMISFRSYFEQN